MVAGNPFDSMNAMINQDPIEDLINELTGGVHVRPMMEMGVESIEIED